MRDEPTSTAGRIGAYQKQTGAKVLTPRQKRRMWHKLNRYVGRTSPPPEYVHHLRSPSPPPAEPRPPLKPSPAITYVGPLDTDFQVEAGETYRIDGGDVYHVEGAQW